MTRATTTEDVLAVVAAGERISYSTLMGRLLASGLPVCGLMAAIDDPRLVRRWNTGELYSPMHVYEAKDRGPLYLERAR